MKWKAFLLVFRFSLFLITLSSFVSLGEGVEFGVIIWHVNRWGILLNKQRKWRNFNYRFGKFFVHRDMQLPVYMSPMWNDWYVIVVSSRLFVMLLNYFFSIALSFLLLRILTFLKSSQKHEKLGMLGGNESCSFYFIEFVFKMGMANN